MNQTTNESINDSMNQTRTRILVRFSHEPPRDRHLRFYAEARGRRGAVLAVAHDDARGRLGLRRSLGGCRGRRRAELVVGLGGERELERRARGVGRAAVVVRVARRDRAFARLDEQRRKVLPDLEMTCRMSGLGALTTAK